MSQGERRLAAIMFTDMVGYTALTQANESQALEVLSRQNTLLRPFFQKFHGREVKTIGDSFLVEFKSALEAVDCAVEIQEFLHDYNSSTKNEWKITLRVGIHLGDVVQSGGDVFGDAVNIASRLQPLAEPEGICVSDQVFGQVRNKLSLTLHKMEPHSLKGVRFPMDVYTVVMPWGQQDSNSQLDKKRIAVLPFTNLSSDPEEGYFADGVTEELITSLSGVRQLTVIARTSVMGYKGTTKKVKDIGGELEAGSVLEGSVRKAKDRVRITAQLIDTATEGHIWAKNYDRQLEDVFAIQSEIAEMVAMELKIRLVDEEKRVIEKKPTENTEAYTYYLRGRQLVGDKTEASLRQALGVFEKALALDPSFAKAFSGLAECYVWLVNDRYDPYELAGPKAELAARKAIQLDPELAEGHAALASVDFLEDKIQEGSIEARRALELNPSLPQAYDILSALAFFTRNIAEGIKAAETAYRLDPVTPRYIENLGRFYFFLGRESDALQHWEKTAQLAPSGTYRNMAEYYLYKGDISKAKEFHSKAEASELGPSWVTWMRGYISAKTGDKDGALESIKAIEKRWVGGINLNDIAFIYHGLGDLDSYFLYINKAMDQHTMRYAYVMYSPFFTKSREDPRYQALMDKCKATYAT